MQGLRSVEDNQPPNGLRLDRCFKLVHLNVRSLPPKFSTFRDFFNNVNPSIFCVSESWLTDSIPSDHVAIPDYKTYRADRSTRGGGLLIYVHNGLKSVKIDLIPGLKYPGFEQLWVLITLPNKTKLVVAVVYRPKEVPVQCMSDLDMMIRHTQLNIADNTLITGDFNIDVLPNATPCTAFSNLLNDLSLVQLIDKPTRITDNSESCIDLIVVNNNSSVVSADVIECSLSDHFAISCVLDFSAPSNSRAIKIVRDYKGVSCPAMAHDLSCIDWSSLYLIQHIDQKVEFFNTAITNIFDKHAPYKLIKVSTSRRSQPWFTDTLRRIRKTKIYAFKCYKRSGLESHRRFYCDIRNYYNFALDTEKNQYYRHMVSDNIGNPKKLWSGLKSSLPDCLSKRSASSISNCGYSADTFNDFFIDSVSRVSNSDDSLADSEFQFCHDSRATFLYRPVSPEVISRLLFKQKPSGIGSDCISAKMLQMSSEVCVLPLTHIINSSFEQGIVPRHWKTSICVPIPKKGTPASLSDFRNISLQCIQSKIAETVLCEQMVEYVETILPSRQSAFRQNYSTTTVCLSVLNDILCARDKGNITALVMLDMTKAFDCVNHDILISKLVRYGFDDSIVSWFSSYLSLRRQYVRLDDLHISGTRDILSGVPQGSVLGPILFNLYISDLARTIQRSECYLYADDVQIYVSFSPHDAVAGINDLNRDLEAIHRWTSSNHLHVNPDKSQATLFGTAHSLSLLGSQHVSIKFAGETLSISDSSKNLGLRFDKYLSFEEQVNYLCRISYTRLRLLYPVRSYFSQEIRLLLVESLILSLFNYGDCVYGPCLTQESKRRLQVSQNFCFRFVKPIPYFDHITPHYRELRLLKLCERRCLHYVTLLCKIITTQKPSYLYEGIEFRNQAHDLNLRHGFTVTVPSHSTSKFEASFSYLVSYILNNLGSFICNRSVPSVRHFVKNAILQDELRGIDPRKF